MAAQYIFAMIAAAFLVLAVFRLARDGSQAHPESRTWLLIAAIFSAVSAWMFFQSLNHA
jgi:uncharacterized membrane protein HdeD (DUF308 family)